MGHAASLNYNHSSQFPFNTHTPLQERLCGRAEARAGEPAQGGGRDPLRAPRVRKTPTLCRSMDSPTIQYTYVCPPHHTHSRMDREDLSPHVFMIEALERAVTEVKSLAERDRMLAELQRGLQEGLEGGGGGAGGGEAMDVDVAR